jgi:UDP-N-acetylglucosamine acyltransferase
MFGLNAIGLRRRGFTQEERTRIKRIYKLLFEDADLKDAVSFIKKQFEGDKFAETIVSFVNGTKRGIYHWHPGSNERRGGEK